MDVSERLTRWVTHVFPDDRERVLDLLRSLPEPYLGRQDVERMHASLVISADGRWDRVQQAEQLARTDWRDVLVAAGLAGDDWPGRLDDILDEGQKPVEA